MDIGEAVRNLRGGLCVRRAGWNGKGMFLVLVPGTPRAKIKEGTPYFSAGLFEIDIGAHVDMFTAQGMMQPGWLCSQADLLAEDWELA